MNEKMVLAWLRAAKAQGGELPMPSRTVRVRFLHQLRKVLGLDGWPQDILRHTAASYWLAVEPDAARLALELGNSAKILLTNYRELVTPEAAAAFWVIEPSVPAL